MVVSMASRPEVDITKTEFYTLGRLFFHYSHFNGNSNDLRLHDEVEFEVIIDRDNRKVATRVMKLKKGTINFESFSPERVNGEVASPPSGNHPGSLSYNSTGEFFFLPFGASDISSACQLYKGSPFEMSMQHTVCNILHA